MKDTLVPGIEHTFRYTVAREKTVPHLFPESGIFRTMPQVLATGYFVGLVEWACMEAMAPHLADGEGSVGGMIQLTHTSPTPPGMEVTIRVKCLAVDGRRTLWEFEASDERDPIGRGKHERFTVNWEQFGRKLREKMAD
ncbi:MAG: thioesterase family protein [bacterium]|nr:MAG: thioesterase family protein [bacterium]